MIRLAALRSVKRGPVQTTSRRCVPWPAEPARGIGISNLAIQARAKLCLRAFDRGALNFLTTYRARRRRWRRTFGIRLCGCGTFLDQKISQFDRMTCCGQATRNREVVILVDQMSKEVGCDCEASFDGGLQMKVCLHAITDFRIGNTKTTKNVVFESEV